ncbi:hypothetical protein chiPu_0028563, partial [Chiloscyllium punctatum]|nr:hypothetical protein [Chiloscyllium punctatum]
MLADRDRRTLAGGEPRPDHFQYRAAELDMGRIAC